MTEKEIQKELIIKLREETEEGLMTCIRAIQKYDWNYEKAYEYIIKNKKQSMQI